LPVGNPACEFFTCRSKAVALGEAADGALRWRLDQHQAA